MSVRNSEKNLSLKGVPPLLEEPFQGDSRGCLWVFASLFDNLHAAIREHNVAMRIDEAIGNRKGVNHTRLVMPTRQFSILMQKVDVVFHA